MRGEHVVKTGLTGPGSVHPHMRGEHPHPSMRRGRHGGSSPHAWGTSLPRFSAFPAPRFIPTCVGNIYFGFEDIGHLIGSSPHAWGTFRTAHRTHAALRFIPTCVGNILPRIGWTITTTVHPHMRGEHGYALILAIVHPGSSPHAWGTLPRRRSRSLPAVHPHMRGEHSTRCYP